MFPDTRFGITEASATLLIDRDNDNSNGNDMMVDRDDVGDGNDFDPWVWEERQLVDLLHRWEVCFFVL